MIPLSMPLSTPSKSRSRQFGDNRSIPPPPDSFLHRAGGLISGVDYKAYLYLITEKKKNLFQKIIRVILKTVQPSQTLDFSARRQLLRLTLVYAMSATPL